MSYNKYISAKQKYIYAKKHIMVGGSKESDKANSKIDEILNFINKSSIDIIKRKLYDIIKYESICSGDGFFGKIETIVGKGKIGKVYIPSINKTFPYIIDDQSINFPIVVKENKDNFIPDFYTGFDIVKNILYINGFRSLTTEALILMYVRKLWHLTLHLPLILTYGTCGKHNVTQIVSLKYGLKKHVDTGCGVNIFNDAPAWYVSKRQSSQVFKSMLTTLKELLCYIHYNRKGDIVMLPNDIECSILELYDYICISFFTTWHLLTINNIFPSDMHCSNIFIHWLNDKSYFNNKSAKDVTHITYKIGKKYYAIKTFGFVIVLGDLGTSIVKIKDDVILAGHVAHIKENYNLLKWLMKPEYYSMDFVKDIKKYIQCNDFSKTVANNILQSEPYVSYPENIDFLLGYDIKFLKELKSLPDLLSYYDELYGIEKYEENEGSILIKC